MLLVQRLRLAHLRFARQLILLAAVLLLDLLHLRSEFHHLPLAVDLLDEQREDRESHHDDDAEHGQHPGQTAVARQAQRGPYPVPSDEDRFDHPADGEEDCSEEVAHGGSVLSTRHHKAARSQVVRENRVKTHIVFAACSPRVAPRDPRDGHTRSSHEAVLLQRSHRIRGTRREVATHVAVEPRDRGAVRRHREDPDIARDQRRLRYAKPRRPHGRRGKHAHDVALRSILPTTSCRSSEKGDVADAGSARITMSAPRTHLRRRLEADGLEATPHGVAGHSVSDRLGHDETESGQPILVCVHDMEHMHRARATSAPTDD